MSRYSNHHNIGDCSISYMYMQLDVATDLFQELAMCQTNKIQ